MKNIVIDSEQEYEEVAKRIEELKDAPAGSHPAKELKLLTKAIIQYQRSKHPPAGNKTYDIKF